MLNGLSRRAAARSETERALNEWKAAMAYYECVSDPALMEYAIFGIEAARRKYEYLLKKCKAD